MEKKKSHTKLSAAGLLITLGVVYGDIGTSPLYVMKAILEENGGITTVSKFCVGGSLVSFLDGDAFQPQSNMF